MNLRCVAYAVAIATSLSSAALADERTFSTCRINFIARWVSTNCPGQIYSAQIVEFDQMRDFVGRTAPDCYRGEGDAKNDVERLLSAGGKTNSCKFYAPIIKSMLK
jgi:hypothetical protein